MPAHLNPSIYHIVHADRLQSIIGDGFLWSDADLYARQKQNVGTTIGMSGIKTRRMNELTLTSHPSLFVGSCVPFYFCPRSVMLYLIHCRNAALTYQGGQGPIVHLEGNMKKAVAWAKQNHRRWAFSLSNAGSYYFEDRCDLEALEEIDWDAVNTRRWGGSGVSQHLKEGKQAEFLIEQRFPWSLVERIGVLSNDVGHRVAQAIKGAAHRPRIEIQTSWYY